MGGELSSSTTAAILGGGEGGGREASRLYVVEQSVTVALEPLLRVNFCKQVLSLSS
jgi:hypothetical protein